MKSRKKIDYDYIRERYPDTLKKDAIYRLAHCSKKTSSYYLDSGLLPSVSTGKKTRQYTIKTEDFIEFLHAREEDPGAYLPPPGYYQNPYTKRKKKTLLPYIEQKQMFEFIQTYLQQFEDVLSVKEVALLLGYSQSSVVKWCRTKRLTAFDVGGHIIIPKLSLIDFLFGPHFDGIRPSGTVTAAFFKAKKAHQL